VRHAIAAITIGLALAGAAGPRNPDMDRRPPRSTDLPRPRDPAIAVREELEAARRAGTVAAYDLFIARHPEHRLAQVARRERAQLMRRRPSS
jgi:hypothetical protein